MKRSNKLSLKTETVRQLTNADLGGVVGGLLSGDCVKSGGAAGQAGSITSERLVYDINQQAYVWR